MSVVSVRNIEKVPGRCGGSAVIRNTRIRVCVIAQSHRRGMTVDDILAAYPHLHPADVHDALAYAHEFPEEIAADVAADDETAVQATWPRGPQSS